MTLAQERMMKVLKVKSGWQLERFPDGGGWVEWWDIVDEWGTRVPLAFVPNAASRTWDVLVRLGLIEEHSEHAELVRPKA